MPIVPRITHGLIAGRYVWLLLALAAAGFSILPASRLEFDRSIENMFAADDPLLVPFRQLQRTFGGDEVVMAAYVDPRLMTQPGYERIDRLSRRIEQVDGVAGVLSLSKSPLGPTIIQTDNSAPQKMLELFEGYCVGADHETAAVVCFLRPRDSASRTGTIDQLRSIVTGHDIPGVLAGEPVMVTDGFAYIETDGRRLAWLSTGLLMAAVVFCFRSLRWVIVPVVVVNVAIVVTQAVLVLGRFRLSMVSTMLSAIITVIGIATVIHVVVRFREARSSGRAPREALAWTGHILAAPIFWACTTDAVGFLCLLISRVGPIQDFGLMMAIGVLITLVSVAVVVPGLTLAGRFDVDPRRMWGERGLDVALNRVILWVERRPLQVAAVSLPPMLLAAAGCARLEVESDFTKNFRAGSPIVQSYELIESRLGGAGVWDVILPAPETIDRAYLQRVRRLEQRLRSEATIVDTDGRRVPGLTKVLSLADAIDAMPVPPGARLLATPEFMIRQMHRLMPTIVESLRGHDPAAGGAPHFRIMLRSLERQPAQQKKALIRQVRNIVAEEFPEARVTGYFVLLANLIDSVIRDQWLAFALASAGIGLMMTIAFRSPALALVAMVPNMTPILIVTGLLGWFGVKINMGAAMIACVSIGLSVDSSIHYLTGYRRALAAGRSPREALQEVHQSVGRAVVFATAALVIGFGAMCFSQFVPTIYFGALVGLAMLGGLWGNLVVLPLLLLVITPAQRGTAADG